MKFRSPGQQTESIGKNFEKKLKCACNSTTFFRFMVNAQLLTFKIHIYTYYFDDNKNTLCSHSLKHVIYCSTSGTELLMHSYTPLGEKCHTYV